MMLVLTSIAICLLSVALFFSGRMTVAQHQRVEKLREENRVLHADLLSTTPFMRTIIPAHTYGDRDEIVVVGLSQAEMDCLRAGDIVNRGYPNIGPFVTAPEGQSFVVAIDDDLGAFEPRCDILAWCEENVGQVEFDALSHTAEFSDDEQGEADAALFKLRWC